MRGTDPTGRSCTKVTVKPVELKGALLYRFSSFCGPKVPHEKAELEPAKAEEKLGVMLAEQFRQGLLQTGEADYQVLVSKKGLVLSQESWEVEGQQLLELGGSHITQVGEREGCVFLFVTPSDVQFSLDDEEKKTDYMSMSDDLGAIKSSFAVH
ncbi:methyltransferase [Paenibacillus caseinilyticus]|uniref:Methyltransferase n=1 Tax=Paenibacillus mucilaginosus K02 TaxID=997761 RepID=I0BJJ4_9BACL|nr:hypothetical protein [Paenibacillus mucilaginosus]AFH62541.2 methyltransferase [Paenibacillus mucilaginosus K02]